MSKSTPVDIFMEHNLKRLIRSEKRIAGALGTLLCDYSPGVSEAAEALEAAAAGRPSPFGDTPEVKHAFFVLAEAAEARCPTRRETKAQWHARLGEPPSSDVLDALRVLADAKQRQQAAQEGGAE